MSQPSGQLDQPHPPSNRAARPGRRPWIIVLIVVVAVLVGGGFAVTSMLLDEPASGDESQSRGTTSATSPASPEPITRAELMSEYAKILPNDPTATPDAVDRVAQQSCDLLDSGSTTDELITAVNHLYQAKSTEVMQLLVAYGCPEHLADFK